MRAYGSQRGSYQRFGRQRKRRGAVRVYYRARVKSKAAARRHRTSYPEGTEK